MLKLDKPQRIAYLKEIILESPDNPFGYYALCLECESENQADNTKSWLDLLERFPLYLPSYYMAGKAFYELGQKEKAITIWQKGLLLAKEQGNNHTIAELKSAIQNALVDEDEN